MMYANLCRVRYQSLAWSRRLPQVVKESPQFFESLSSAASVLSCPVGAVLRAVLPFDEETSSNDQSAITDSNSTSPSKLLLMQSSQRRGDISPQSLAKVEAELTRLRAQAVDIRRTVRVKMADEADLKQVHQPLRLAEVAHSLC